MKNLKQVYLSSLLALLTTVCFAQDKGYYPGAIIDLQNNRIDCQIKPGNQKWVGVKINGQKATYKASQIKGYYVGEEKYVALKDLKIKVSTELYASKHKFLFAKPVCIGRINLYVAEMETLLGGTIQATVNIYIIEKDGQQELIQLPNRLKKMRIMVNSLIADTPPAIQFESDRKFYHDQVPQIIRDYNVSNN